MTKSKEVADFAQIPCKGADPRIKHDPTNYISLTLYDDGEREIGCAYLAQNGDCRLSERKVSPSLTPIVVFDKCVHLFPISNKRVTTTTVRTS